MTLQILFLIVAVVLFVAAAMPKLTRPWFIPIGLAFFAGSFLPLPGLT